MNKHADIELSAKYRLEAYATLESPVDFRSLFTLVGGEALE